MAVCSLLFAPPARAGLDLTWGAPNSAGGDTSTFLGCSDPDSAVTLYACFQVPDTVREFVALTAVLEIRAEADSLPPFWRFDQDAASSGCNSRGLAVSKAFPEDADESLENPWGPMGAAALSGARASAPDSTRPATARIVCQMVRGGLGTLVPGHNYFAFAFRFLMDKSSEAGGACVGCRVPVVIQWKSAVFEEAQSMIPGQFIHPMELNESGLRGSCVRVNGARSRACDRPSPAPKTGAAKR